MRDAMINEEKRKPSGIAAEGLAGWLLI